MNPQRRTLLVCGLAQVTLSLIACASEPAVRQRTYKEQVSTLLLSKDGKQLVILGAAHHYVFDATPDIVALTQSALKSRVEARIEPFTVARDGQTDGAYSLHLPNGLSRAEAQAARDMGFQQLPGGDWQLDNRLHGTRYLVGNATRDDRLHEKLVHTYTVTVIADETAGQHIAEKATTPVKIGAEGVLLVYFAALAPVIIPIVFLSREKRALAVPASIGGTAP